MKNAVLNIIYDESDQMSYEAIEINFDDNKKRFDSGDITVDFIDYIKWYSESDISIVMYSSSWDHFFMDGDYIVPLYIDHNNGHKVITDFSNMSISDINKLTEYPVQKHIKTFEDLKNYYKSKNGK